MVACRLWMYSIIVHSHTASIASATRGYSQFPYSALWAVIPTIRQANLWWNPSSILSNSHVITQLSLQYSSKICVAILYSIKWAIPFLLYSLAPWISYRRISETSTGCGIQPPNLCYYMWYRGQGKERLMQDIAASYSPEWRTDLTQNSSVGYPSKSVSYLWSGTSPTRSGGC